MAHEIIIDGTPHTWRGAADLGPAGRPWLRAHRLANGDTVVITAAAATRDGAPLLGNLAVVPWGASALLRVGAARVEIAWQSRAETGTAPAATRCRLCFGAVTAGELQVQCSCAATFHEECDRVRHTCPACGQPPGGPIA